MGDYVVNPKCLNAPKSQLLPQRQAEQVQEVSDLQLLGSVSPTATVLHPIGSSASDEDEGSHKIRVRPLHSLTSGDKSPSSLSPVSPEDNINRDDGSNGAAGPGNGGGGSSLSLRGGGGAGSGVGGGKNQNDCKSLAIVSPHSRNIAIRQEEVPKIRRPCDPNWRVLCPGVKDKLKFILSNDSAYQDVVFVVGKGRSKERISAHKLILRLGSPVLEKILFGLNQDPVTPRSVDDDPIDVPEVEPFAFRYLLKFMYTDEFDPNGLNSSDIMAVHQAARLFEVHDLAHLSIQSLKNRVTDENAILLCELAREIEDTELKDVAIAYICRNAQKIFNSINFMELSYANLLLLVQNDNLEWDELLIFKAVVRWGDEFCKRRGLDPVPENVRGALGQIIYKVRFPLMSAEEFTFDVVPTKVLTSEEQVQIFKYLCLAGNDVREQLEPTSFSCKRRNHMEIKPERRIKDDDTIDSFLSKFKTEPGESPHCQPALASTSTDMTEAESEDASSHVSSARSQASSHTQRSTHPPKKKRFRSQTPPPKHSDLFGDTPPRNNKGSSGIVPKKRKSIELEKNISLSDCEIEFNQFVEDCSTNSQRKEIESIRMSGVKVTDHDKLIEKRVRLPKLKEFHLDIRLESLKHSEVNSLAGTMNLEQFLFFSIKVTNPNWSLSEIWSLGVNISIVINGITMLTIDHEKKTIMINKLKDCTKILESTEGESGVKSLILSHQKFPGHVDLFPSHSLERLVLLSVNQIPEVNKFLKKFKRLRELCVLSTDSKKIDLGHDLLCKERLKKLAVGSAKFTVSLPTTLKSLEDLFLWRCEWGSTFEDNFHQVFPNLKKVSILGSKVGPRLLKKILKIKTVEEITCGSLDWSSSDDSVNEIKDILLLVGLSENEKSFVLKKDDEGNSWSGKKGTFEMSQEEIFKNFQFYHLYKNYETFKS